MTVTLRWHQPALQHPWPSPICSHGFVQVQLTELPCNTISFSFANALLPQALLVRLGSWDMGAQVLPLQCSGLVKIPLLQCAELNALHQKDETRGNLCKMYFLSENTLKMLTWLDLARGISIYTNQGWSKIYWSQWKNSLASKQFGWKAWDAQKAVFFELFAELILGLWPYQTKQLWSSKMSEDTSERLAHLWMEKEEQIQKTEEL